MKSVDSVEKLEVAVKNLHGRECWALIAGEGTGSAFSMKMGEKIPRKRPLQNPFLSADAKIFDGEYCLYVQFSSWRLDDVERVICTSTDSNENDGVMVQGLSRLVGCRISGVSLTKPGCDLIIDLDRGYRLTVFCCWSNVLEPATNYSFFTPEIGFSVESRSEVRHFY